MEPYKVQMIVEIIISRYQHPKYNMKNNLIMILLGGVQDFTHLDNSTLLSDAIYLSQRGPSK